MNYVTGEPKFEQLWNQMLDDRQRGKSLVEWRVFSEWVERKSGSDNKLITFDIDKKIVSFMDRLRDQYGIPQAMLVTFYLASNIAPMSRTETADRVHCRIIDTSAVLSLFKECNFYQEHLDQLGYDGEPRNLWELDNELFDAQKRSEWSKNELIVRGLLKERS